MNVSLCIATHRRPGRLAALLSDIAQQDRRPSEVIVVDNDAAGSAQPVVERFVAEGAPFPLRYEVQPVRGIALTRNRTVQLASGDWIAFIDDDERPPKAWLQRLVDAAARYEADGVLGPVLPVVPPEAPAWIRRGRFYDVPELASGGAVPLNKLRIGNALVRGDRLRAEPGPFDTAYGLKTGEDGDMLARLVHKGAKIVWCREAAVQEPVEPRRLRLEWLLQRGLSGGQEFARMTLAGRYGPVTGVRRTYLFLRALAQLIIALGLTIATCPMGRHHAARWLIAASANLGKLTVFFGWHYSEYA
jgi:succinoglycan biosynthesis protein ExoM